MGSSRLEQKLKTEMAGIETADFDFRDEDYTRNLKEAELKKKAADVKSDVSGEWKHGICGCLGDCEICLCGACVPCLLIKRNADDLGKPGLLCCLLSCFLPCIPIFMLRSEARERYGIEGSTAGDAVCSFCCGPLVACQTGAEINERGDHS